MKFKSLYLSLFVVLTLGLALLARADDDKTPRGPKITNKACLLVHIFIVNVR
jgi:hypothetical protein